MKLKELIGVCERAIVKGHGHLYLTIPLPKRYTPHRDGVKLLGNAGPRGKVCTIREETGELVAVFKARAILDFLEKEKLRGGNDE